MPAATATSRKRAPAKPRAANSCSAASRMRSWVAAALRSRLGGAEGGGGSERASGRRIPCFVLNHAQLFKALSHVGRKKPESLDVRDDLGEEQRLERLHDRALLGGSKALVDREIDVLPHLLHQESIAHEARRLDDELLAVAELTRGHVLVDTAQRHHAEGNVPRLVDHDHSHDLFDQRLVRALAEEAERREREP